MMIDIQEVAYGSSKYEEVLRLRDQVLRQPLGLKLNQYDVMFDDKEFHIAAFEEGNMVGCVLLRPVGEKVVKLRQMAVVDSWQGRGLGKMLVTYAEQLAKGRGFSKVETHARKTAQGFYGKLGYIAEGEEFEEVTVRTIKMCKQL